MRLAANNGRASSTTVLNPSVVPRKRYNRERLRPLTFSLFVLYLDLFKITPKRRSTGAFFISYNKPFGTRSKNIVRNPMI